MSKVSTSTENNLRTARYKMSGSLVKENRFTSKDKVMEIRTHAAHIKVKSYNSLIKNNGTSQSWYNNNTSSSSIQSELKLNKRKWQPRNEDKLYHEIEPEQNKSRYSIKKEEQRKRPAAYKRQREEQVNPVAPLQDSHSKVAEQSTKRQRALSRQKGKQEEQELPEAFNNGIIRVTIPNQSIINPTSNVTQVIRLTEDRASSHLSKVRSFKLVNDKQQKQHNTSKTRYNRHIRTRLKLMKVNPIGPTNDDSINSYSRYSNESTEKVISPSNKRRLRLIRSAGLINETAQNTIPYSRYSFNPVQSNLNNGQQLLKRRIKLNRMKQYTLKEGEKIKPSSRYTTNPNSFHGNNHNSLNAISRKNQFNRMAASLNQSTQVISRNEEEASFGNKVTHQTINQLTKIPAYKATGKQVIQVLDASRKNVEGVFSQKTSITQMITNANEGRKNLNISTSIRKSIKNVDGNGDLGIDTVVQTKNTLLKTDKTLRVTSRAIKNTPRYTKKSVSGFKKSVQAVKWTAKAIKHPIQATKYLAMTTKVALKSLLNPIVLKGIMIFGLIAVVLFSCIAAFSGITSVYAALTYTSTKEDLNETWKYITELDADIEYEFETIEENPRWSHIDEFHLEMKYFPQTSASKVIAYLTAKYDDFEFSEVSGEISSIHDQLYQISYNEWEQEVEECETDDEGEEDCYSYIVTHLDATLDGKPFTDWLETDGKLNESQKERYDNTLEIGGTVMLAEFSNPFGDEEWFSDINTRYGYRVNPDSKEIEFYNGIEIKKPPGTQVKSISAGTVKTGVDETGRYVDVTKKSKKITTTIKYYYLQSVSVSDGQVVKKGEEIGTTGSSLLLSYELDGEPHNPWFYTEGGYGVDLENGYNSSTGTPTFPPEFISQEGWAWPTQSTNISSHFGYRIHPITGEHKLHAGTDITPISTVDAIQSMATGIVTFAGYHKTGGNMIVINHGNGIQSKYMHLKSMSVRTGNAVSTSQNIGIMGNTGSSTNTHLHFEIHINGQPVDPVEVFKNSN